MRFWFVLAAACGPKEVPPHLRPDTVQDEVTSEEVVDLPSALAHILQGDPLARRTTAGAAGDWAGLEQGLALEEWADLARRGEAAPSDWQTVEAHHRGTVAVGLSRGAQLAGLEVSIASHAELQAGPRPVGPRTVAWLAPLQLDEQIYPRDSVAWLQADRPEAIPEALLYMAERRVLLGWLDGPDVPLEAVDLSLQEGLHGRLLGSPAGALVRARARGNRDEAAATQGRAALAKATFLALTEASADRDNEQLAWRDTLESTRSQLHTQKPIAHLLAEARVRLTADAASDRSTGLALVALSAERLRGTCPDRPCTGLGRTATLARGPAWDDEVARTAARWQVIVLKNAVDAFEVSWSSPTFANHAPLLADALLGTGAGSVELGLLRHQSAGPSVFLALSRAAGGGDHTDADGTRRALRDRLVVVVDLALEQGPPPETEALLTRIRRRATP